MSVPFRADQGLIIVLAKATGPDGEQLLRLALDTGASQTLLNAGITASLGYSPAQATDWIEVTTATQIERVPLIALERFEALGQVKTAFAVICHDLPPAAEIDGLLGLDFLRGSVLTIDFQTGRLNLVV